LSSKNCNYFLIHGKISITNSNKLVIIGIDIAIIITLLPISILLAIAFSPASEQILTANSVINAIPVIFSKILRKLLFYSLLFGIDYKSNNVLTVLNNELIC